MGVWELENWNPRFCRMSRSHWVIVLARYKLRNLESVEWATEDGWVLAYQWTAIPPQKEDDTGYGTFFIGGMAFSTIWKINKVIGYLLVVEVAWGNLLVEVTGGSAIKARGIHYMAVRLYRQLAGEVLDSLEGWFWWSISMNWEKVEIIYEIMAGVFHNMEKFSYMCTEFH